MIDFVEGLMFGLYCIVMFGSFYINALFVFSLCSMNPGDSKAMEGIQNVERANGGEVEHDSGEEAEEPNGEGVSLEEVLKNKQFSFE